MDNQEILEFGIKRENEERRDGGCAVVFDPETKLFAVGKDNVNGFLRFFGGGVDKNEDAQTGILRELTEESGLDDFLYVEKISEVLVHYYNRIKKVNRFAHATCFLVILKSRNLVETKLEEHENFILDWAGAETLFSDWKSRNQEKDYDHWFYFLEKSMKRIKELGFN
ncbi:MAG: NUDIX hydrolase [Candidatus Paceibacterota bacterium]|jgi:8-oxo-dGTP pyrophosphatase MutT (NUDIX family)